MSEIARLVNSDPGTVALIIEALQQKLNHDLRDHMTKPLFHTGKTSVDSLRSGDIMTGVVSMLYTFL